MAFDDTFKILDAAFSQTAATTVNSTALELGRTGLPKGAQFVVVADNPGGPADATNTIVKLQLSLDNGVTYRDIAVIELGDPGDGFQGQIAEDIALAFAWQEYADANIQVRVATITDGSASPTTYDKLAAYITQGEVTHWGRAKAADTLFE